MFLSRVAVFAALVGTIGTVLFDAVPSTAIVPPSSTTSPPISIVLPPGGIVPPPTTTSPPLRTTTPLPSSTEPGRTTTTTPPPSTALAPAATAGPPPPAPPQPGPPPPREQPPPEPPCQRDAIDDFYTATKDEVLVVPYEAGLGLNDVLECGGPGYTIDNLTDPPHGTVVKTPNDFGAFEYTPDPAFTGSDSFTYTLYQGQQVADQATAYITVTEACMVVGFQDVYYTAFETPVSEAAPGFLANDTVECQPFAANVAAPPTDGTVTAAVDGSFDFTPDPGFWGVDEFSYEIRDANQVVMGGAQVLIVVDKPPCVAVDDGYSTTVDTTLTVGVPGVLANDLVCPDFSTLQIGQQPANGTVTLQVDGAFQYVPNPGFVGQDSFTYDHQEFDITIITYVVLATATVTIDVTETPATTEPSDTTATTEPADTTPTTEPADTTPTTEPADTTPTTEPDATETTEPVAPTTPAPGPGPETPPSSPPTGGFRVATINAVVEPRHRGRVARRPRHPG